MINQKYHLTEEDIQILSKRSAVWDWISDFNDPRSFEEYKIEWDKRNLVDQ